MFFATVTFLMSVRFKCQVQTKYENAKNCLPTSFIIVFIPYFGITEKTFHNININIHNDESEKEIKNYY